MARFVAPVNQRRDEKQPSTHHEGAGSGVVSGLCAEEAYVRGACERAVSREMSRVSTEMANSRLILTAEIASCVFEIVKLVVVVQWSEGVYKLKSVLLGCIGRNVIGTFSLNGRQILWRKRGKRSCLLFGV